MILAVNTADNNLHIGKKGPDNGPQPTDVLGNDQWSITSNTQLGLTCPLAVLKKTSENRYTVYRAPEDIK